MSRHFTAEVTSHTLNKFQDQNKNNL